MSEYECRYLFEENTVNTCINYRDLTYRELQVKLSQSKNKTEVEALLYELQIREFDVMQARRKCRFIGNYPYPKHRT